MTKPDRWNEVVDAILDNNEAWNFGELSLMGIQKLVLAALRDAEKAGMERAAEFADAHAEEYEAESIASGTLPDEMHAAGARMACMKLADSIRAAKETKEPPSPS